MDKVPESLKSNPLYKNMNEDNKKATIIAETEGMKEAIKHMFNPTGKKELTYAEMRERYG
jgi:hypothetical protein